MAGPQHPYLDLVVTRAAEPARVWFLQRHAGLGVGDFAVVYAGAGRRLGAAPVQATDAERQVISAAGLLVPQGWPLSAVGRAALLLRVCEGLPEARCRELASGVFRTGDNDERAALLRTLSLLPAPEGLVEIGIEACRSHVQSVFEAIACENPYPMRHFPEHNFNQLVLKSFFTGVAVERIQGLAQRRTPELVRMAQAYASERRAAGRSVPVDLELVTGS